MRRREIILILLLTVASVLGSCSKDIAGKANSPKLSNTGDDAQYNFMLAEGMRLKLTGNQADAIQFFEKCIEINPEKSEPYYNIAQIAIQGGQLKEAVRYAAKAVELAPDNIWYVKFAAGVFYQDSNIAKAIELYEGVVSKDENDIEMLLTLSNLYVEAGKNDKAEKILEGLTAKFGISEKFSPNLAQLRVMRKDYAGAEKIAKALISIDPENLEYHSFLAEVYTLSGDRTKAMEVYSELIEKNKDDGKIQISLLQFLLEEKEDDEVINLLNVIILNSTIPVEAKNEILLRILDYSALLEAKGKELELIIMINEAAAEEPNLQTSIIRPEFFLKEGRTKDAINRFEELITQFGEFQYLVERVLLLYYETGDYNMLYDRAKVLAPKVNRSVIAKMMLAIAATEKKEFQVAVNEARKAAILAEGNKEIMVQVISIEADALYKMGKTEEAFATFEKALEINPEEIIILNNYAYFLAENNVDLPKALKMSAVVIEKEPESNTYLDTYAWVLYKMGKYRKAEKIMEKIIQSKGDKVGEHFEHYGYILKERKRCGEAVIYWNKALEMGVSGEKLRTEIENCTK